jgi:hypothetical protein
MRPALLIHKPMFYINLLIKSSYRQSIIFYALALAIHYALNIRQLHGGQVSQQVVT